MTHTTAAKSGWIAWRTAARPYTGTRADQALGQSIPRREADTRTADRKDADGMNLPGQSLWKSASRSFFRSSFAVAFARGASHSGHSPSASRQALHSHPPQSCFSPPGAWCALHFVPAESVAIFGEGSFVGTACFPSASDGAARGVVDTWDSSSGSFGASFFRTTWVSAFTFLPFFSSTPPRRDPVAATLEDLEGHLELLRLVGPEVELLREVDEVPLLLREVEGLSDQVVVLPLRRGLEGRIAHPIDVAPDRAGLLDVHMRQDRAHIREAHGVEVLAVPQDIRPDGLELPELLRFE